MYFVKFLIVDGISNLNDEFGCLILTKRHGKPTCIGNKYKWVTSLTADISCFSRSILFYLRIIAIPALYFVLAADPPLFGLLLSIPEFFIQTVPFYQLVMLTSLHNLPLIKYNDLICAANGSQVMGDNQDRPVHGQIADGPLYFYFIDWINIACDFIQNNNGRVF